MQAANTAGDAGTDAFTEVTDYPLLVITVTSEDGENSGCLVGFFAQCSILPPRFLACISKVNHTFFAAERSRGMTLHLLGSDQQSLASLFAETTGDSYDKFAHCDWTPAATGGPVLSDCAAWLECEIVSRQGVGDHEAFLLRPCSGGRGTHSGLLTFQHAPDLAPAHPVGS